MDKDFREREAMLILVLTLLLWPVIVIWNGWIVTNLWKWFVVPVFDLPVLSIVQAIGLCLAVRVMLSIHWLKRVEIFDKTSPPAEKFWTNMAVNFTVPTVIFGIGWVLSFFL